MIVVRLRWQHGVRAVAVPEGRRDLPFLWKSHVAVRLHPDTAVALAAGEVLVHEFGDPRVRPEGGRFTWPSALVEGVEHDFRRPPATSAEGVTEFLIATSLTEGHCGVDHPAAGTGSRWRGTSRTCRPAGPSPRTAAVGAVSTCWSWSRARGIRCPWLDGVAAGSHQVLPAGATKAWSLTAWVGAPGGG